MQPTSNRNITNLGCSIFLFACLMLAIGSGIHAADSDDFSTQSGREIYVAACANCHGGDGRGSPASQLGFNDPLPPDFTDCSFASREPDGDWVGIADSGGPTRGFSELMPAHGGVLTKDQLARTIDYIHSFCIDKTWPRGDLNLPKALVTEKAFPEDEALLVTTIDTEGLKSINNKLIYEKRFGSRNQLELVLPFGWKEEVLDSGRTNTTSGIGDIGIGFKRVLFHSLERGSIFSITGEVKLPTGDRESGYGKDTTIFEPFLTYSQILPADFFLHSQAGLELPADRDLAENEAFLRVALGKTLTSGEFGRSWSPMIEFLGKRELASGEEVIWDIVPEIQITLNTRQHIMLNIGVRTPLTHTEGRDSTIMIYLLWDWFDGGFFEGW